MKLEDQVCSLELSKRLKELGVKQDSHFYWQNFEAAHKYEDLALVYTAKTYDEFMIFPFGVKERINCESEWDEIPVSERQCFSAFTVAELINMLQEITQEPIIIPVGESVANYLAQELIDEKSSKKN